MPDEPRSSFVPPPYPYDRLDGLKAQAEALPGGCVDLSIGTPVDPPPDAVVAALSSSDLERGYPPSIGTAELRQAAVRWLDRRLGAAIDPQHIGACVGTKEFVATLPQWLRLRRPDRDTVLYPEIAYPTYEMGAIFAGCRPVPVPVDDRWRIDLEAIRPRTRLGPCACGSTRPATLPVASTTSMRPPSGAGALTSRSSPTSAMSSTRGWVTGRTILRHGLDGVVSVHSLSKRSNFAGGAPASTPVTQNWCTTSRRFASTPV